jgi:putative ABC transport system permease protein
VKPGAIPLDELDLAAAAALMLIAGLASLALKLGLEKKLLVASVRTVVQLLLIGFILDEVFALDAPWAVLVVCAVMVGAAGRAAVQRSSRSYKGAMLQGTLTLAIVGASTAILGTAGIVGAEPWWRPQYLIPMLGMLLGNSLTGISLCLDSLLEAVGSGRARIEAELALGATRWEAARRPVSEAIRRGMIPILNTMTVVGIVSLPGMMTGQILAGADPMGAVRYQIVIMFLIATSTTMGALSVALLAYRALFNARHQLLFRKVVERAP